MSAIFKALEEDETNRIGSCTIAHDVWEALRLAFEVIKLLRNNCCKLFEDLRMFVTKHLNKFYLRDSTIINQIVDIQHKFDDLIVERKIIECFQENNLVQSLASLLKQLLI